MSQPQLRPNATVATTGLAVTGGASADVVLDDTPDADGSYVQASGSSAATATLQLTDPTWPAGAVSKQARIQLRGRATSGYTPGRGIAELRSGSMVVATFDNQTWTSAATWVTKAGAWFPINLTQAEVNALQLWVRVNRSQTNPYPILCSEVYVDVVLAERATAAITTATTAYTSSTITTDWTHTPGADGGDQSHYRVVFLTAAQVATITGGDPLTSTAGVLFDTGDVEGAQASYTATGIPALTAGAARYVRTADLVNGVPHWSAWTSQGITNTLTTAEVLTLTATADAANGRVTVTAGRDTGKDAWTAVAVERAATLLDQTTAGFEGAVAGGVAAGWVSASSGVTTATFTVPTVSPRGQVQRINATGVDPGDWATVTTVAPWGLAAAGIVAGDVVEVSAWISALAGTYAAKCRPLFTIDWYQGSALVGSWSQKMVAGGTAGTFYQYTVQATVPAAVTHAKVGVGLVGDTTAANATGQIDVDAVTVTRAGSWAPLVGSPVAASGNTATVQDYEVPPSVWSVWRARATNAGGSQGAWTYTAPAAWTMAGTEEVWLKAPGQPGLNMRPWVTVRPLENSRPRRQQVFQLLDDDSGRWAREVVTNGRLGGRVTSLVVRTETLAQAAQLLELAKVGVVDVHPPASWRFAPGRFVLADLSEDVGEEIGTDYEYQLWTIEIREVV